MLEKNLWTIIGLAAALLTSTSFIPQLLLRLRKPAEARLSYGTLAAFLAGSLLWAAYGVHLRDMIIIGANVFIFSNLVLLAGLQIFQKKV
jgi:MtN3 and saliva related transmembrane protein